MSGWLVGILLAAGLLVRASFQVILISLVVGSVIYYLLALRNPVPRVTLTPGQLTPGASSLLTWSFPEGAERLQDLRIFLEGREGYDVADSTMSDFSTSPGEGKLVDRIEVLTLAREAAPLASGSTPIALPRSTRPSLAEPGHQILWHLHLQGKIRFWPDLAERFAVEVATPPPAPLHPTLARYGGRTDGSRKATRPQL